jgi:hypothetical protein
MRLTKISFRWIKEVGALAKREQGRVAAIPEIHRRRTLRDWQMIHCD